MLKMNKKGFALVETLIVTVFVATIFTVMYTNFFPMFGEYERREQYDDIDSIYRTYLIKRMLENPSFRGEKESYTEYINTLNSENSPYYVTLFSVDYQIKNDEFTNLYSNINTICNDNLASSQYLNYCTNMLSQVKVEKIYLTNYWIKDLKSVIKKGDISETDMDAQMQDYIDSLPYFSKNTSNCNYRIIVQYAKEINKESETYRKIIYSFSTIGVNIENEKTE